MASLGQPDGQPGPARETVQSWAREVGL